MRRTYAPLRFVTRLLFLFMVPALFSCLSPLAGGKGAVRIHLPGQSARSAFTDYAAALEYRVDCTGPGGKISKNAGAGSVITIELEAGEWEVGLTALHFGSPVGSSASVPVSVVNGETTSVNLSVAVDFSEATLQSVIVNGTADAATTTRLTLYFDKDIPGLSAADIAITDGGVTKGELTKVLNTTGWYTLAVNVTRQETISVAVTKPGYYVSPPANQVTVHYKTPEPNEEPNGQTGWPPDTTWALYDLSGLQQPDGTGVKFSSGADGTLVVQLENADQSAYENLYTQIQEKTGQEGTHTSIFWYVGYDRGEFNYSTFTLTIMWTPIFREITLTVRRQRH